MSRARLITLTNMCMLTNNQGQILVQDRHKPTWPGVTFPGGHVEIGESLHASMIREMKEETGLTIEQPQLCGIMDFTTEQREGYLILLYRAHKFTGTLCSSSEGPVFWIQPKDLVKYKLSPDFLDMYQIFIRDELSELYGMDIGTHWHKQTY